MKNKDRKEKPNIVNEAEQSKKQIKRKVPLLIILLIFILVAIGCGAYIFHYYHQLQTARNVYEELAANAVVEETTEANESEEAEEVVEESTTKEPDEDAYMTKTIDFDSLHETNEDIYAWIEIPGTTISYPILQYDESDDTYYLNHTVEHADGYPGSIYTEHYNTKDFTDRNTVIYGHNMKDGSMFSDLHDYEDKAFMEENPYVYIYTEDRTLKYQIFASYVTDDKHILTAYDFSDDDSYERYLVYIQNMRDMDANISSTITVGTLNQIITLSTCVSPQSSDRYIVQAVLIDEN